MKSIIERDGLAAAAAAPDLATMRRARVLCASPLFEQIDRGQLMQLAARARIRRIGRGQIVAGSQACASGLHMMISGTAKWTISCPQGRGELLLELLRPGDWFGEAEIFTDSEDTSAATALTDCEVLILPSVDFQMQVARSPKVALKVMQITSARLRRMRQLAADAVFLDLGGRLYRRLAEMCPASLERAIVSGRVDHGLCQRELASSVGSSRESLNKLLASWQRDGLITVGRGYLIINKPLALAKAASSALALPCPSRLDGYRPHAFPMNGGSSPCIP